MLTLIVTFPGDRIVDASERANVYWNVDAAGIASGAPDETTPVNEAPVELFPAEEPGPYWAEGSWGEGVWGGRTAEPVVRFETPEVHFGKVRIAAKAVDRLGNEQSGAIVETTVTVNSTPLPPARLERGTYADGQQAFRFVESPQLKVS